MSKSKKKTGRSKRGRPRSLGDVVAIPLSGGNYAFARVYNEGTLGVFDLLSTMIVEPSELLGRKVVFWGACMEGPIEDGEWPVIGHMPFKNAAEAWSPPRFAENPFNLAKSQIYHKGEFRRATADEIEGLDEFIVYTPKEFISRICSELPVKKKRARGKK